jgi:hypothetical protein
MTKQFLRNTIIDLLDDENGINSKAHDGVLEICNENGWNDINEATELQDGRAFLNEDDAEDLRQVVVEG